MRLERWLYTIPLRLRSLFRRAQADRELDAELRDHLEGKAEEYVAQGMTPDQARRQARLDLGGIEQAKENCRDILQFIIRQGMTLVLVGLVLGIVASIALTRLMSALLFDLSATDPVTFVAVAFLLALVALPACYIPARRAMKVPPTVALRHE